MVKLIPLDLDETLFLIGVNNLSITENLMR